MIKKGFCRLKEAIHQITFIKEWDTIKWAFIQVWSIDKKNLMFWTMLNVLGALTPVVVLNLTKIIVNFISTSVNAGVKMSTIGLSIVVLGILWVLESVYNNFPNIVRYSMQTKYSIAMQKRFMEFTGKIPMRYFDRHKSANRIDRVGQTVNRIAYFIGGCTSFFGKAVGVVGLLWLAATTSWILLAIGVISVVISLCLSNKAFKQYKQNWKEVEEDKLRQVNYALYISSRLSGKEIRVLEADNFFYKRWSQLTQKISEVEIKLRLKTKHIYNTLSILEVVTNIVVLAVGCLLLSRGKIQLGALVMLWQLSGRLFNSVQSLMGGYHEPLYYIPVLKDQKELFSENFDMSGLPSANIISVENLHKNIVFQFNNVDFGYSPDNTLLKNISFTINKGETVAICGENGAGKSTLIKLLLGLYTPNKGSVLFESLPLDKIPQDYFYGKLGVVFQDFMIYRLTLRENVGFGDISRINDTSAIIEAMRRGQADKLMNLRSKGLETQISKSLYKDGVELSGGEQQRIGVSRAHMSNKEVLIMDEPAAKLDPIAELEQFTEIKRSLGGRTAVLVSHRMGFTRLADRIIVLQGGTITELGTHQELMRKNGVYANMFNAQAGWYERSEKIDA